MRKGTKEIKRRTKGNSYIAAGLVTDTKAVGCPPCDTVYLQLHRDGDDGLFLAITPEEADIICHVLIAAVVRAPRA